MSSWILQIVGNWFTFHCIVRIFKMKTYSRKRPNEVQEEEVIVDLNDLCRLCMSKENELVSIFTNDDSIPLALRILSCVSLEASYHFFLYTFKESVKLMISVLPQIRIFLIYSNNVYSRICICFMFIENLHLYSGISELFNWFFEWVMYDQTLNWFLNSGIIW